MKVAQVEDMAGDDAQALQLLPGERLVEVRNLLGRGKGDAARFLPKRGDAGAAKDGVDPEEPEYLDDDLPRCATSGFTHSTKKLLRERACFVLL